MCKRITFRVLVNNSLKCLQSYKSNEKKKKKKTFESHLTSLWHQRPTIKKKSTRLNCLQNHQSKDKKYFWSSCDITMTSHTTKMWPIPWSDRMVYRFGKPWCPSNNNICSLRNWLEIWSLTKNLEYTVKLGLPIYKIGCHAVRHCPD